MLLGEATIAPGTVSDDVKTIQKILNGGGYNVGPIDGNFGPQTANAVRAFQSSKGLVPDGIVGPLTWDALHGRTATKPPVASLPAPMPIKPAVSFVDSLLSYWWVPVGLTVFTLLRRSR